MAKRQKIQGGNNTRYEDNEDADGNHLFIDILPADLDQSDFEDDGDANEEGDKSELQENSNEFVEVMPSVDTKENVIFI